MVMSYNKCVMPKPNLRFVSRMALRHFMRSTPLPVWLGIHRRYAALPFSVSFLIKGFALRSWRFAVANRGKIYSSAVLFVVPSFGIGIGKGIGEF